MKICILGWYGTETLGDRSILTGLFMIFSKIFNKYEIALGSLYPFLSERTVIEDQEIYNMLTSNMSLKIFCSKSKIQLKDEIKSSDLVIMGGGPIMDLFELEIINYGFKYAKKLRKKTMLLGCGIGPLKEKSNIKITRKILENTDLSIFRDANSLDSAKKILGASKNKKMCYSHDPAILPVYEFIRGNEKKTLDKITINFREFPFSYFEKDSRLNVSDIVEILDIFSMYYSEVILIPMHTFHIGGDDRRYLETIKKLTSAQNVKVLHKPLNLFELFNEFYTSTACIGMRYHSIVFQSLLNGNNFVFDYTNKDNGKISSFINLIDKNQFYKDRYINIQDIDKSFTPKEVAKRFCNLSNKAETFTYDMNIYNDTMELYIREIKMFIGINAICNNDGGNGGKG